MPNVVDFSPLNQTVYDGRGADPIIAALKGIAQQNAAQRQREEQLAFQREQEQRRVLSENDKTQHERMLEQAAQRKQQGIETVANNRGREQADQAIRAAVGVGDLAEARRRAGAYSEVDPATGSVVNGRPFEVDPPQGPAPPPAQPRPVEYGPQATPDEAQNAAMIRNQERNTQLPPGLASRTSLTGQYPGMQEPGNLDLTNRPSVLNADGSRSSVRSMSFQDRKNGPEVLVPTVSDDGRIMNDDQAIEQYHRLGKHLGTFDTPDHATAFAQQLHNQQEQAGDPALGINFNSQGLGGDVALAEAERQRFAQASTPDQSSTLQQQGNQLIDPQQVAVARQAAWKSQQANPAVTIGGVQTTPEAIRYSKSRADAADFGKLGEALAANHAQALQVGDPLALQASERRIQAFQEVMPLVQSGSMTPQAAQARIAAAATGADRYVDQSRLTAQKATDAASLQGQKDVAAGQRAESAAGAALTRDAAKVAAKKEATGGVDPKAAARFEGDVQHFQVNNNISSDRKDEARMATLLNNKDASIVQRAMAGNLARGIGAERGVLTDKDISRLQGSLGGAWGDVENWLSKKDSGDLSPEVKAKLAEGIQIVLAEKAQARKQSEEAYMSTFGAPDSIYAGWGLGEHARRKFKEIFGHDAPNPTAAAGQAAAGGSGDGPPGGVLQRNKKTGEERWRLPDGTTVPR
jgi:hypothetical protein